MLNYYRKSLKTAVHIGIISITIVIGYSFNCFAQTEIVDPDNFTLDKLVETKISIGSAKELSLKETPGFVTIISKEEIRKSGSRDLIDLLRLVPGFDIGLDVQGVLGIGLRGLWAHEGKVLLLYDGHEMNESLYSTLQLGNHYPIENVERIEIIRDPGSILYGGVAEYAVINIVTTKASDKNGIAVESAYGLTDQSYGHKQVNLYAGFGKGDNSFSVFGKMADANRSDRVFNDFEGMSYDMTNSNQIKNNFINANIKLKGFELSSLIDNYSIRSRDGYYCTTSLPYNDINNTYSFALKKPFKLSDKINFYTKIKYKNQTPWKTMDMETADEIPLFNRTSQLYTLENVMDYNIFKNLNFTGGIEYLHQNSTDNIGVFENNNSSQFSFDNWAIFGQALYRTRNYTLIAGSRLNINSIFEAAFVPRIGITKVWDKVYAKLLLSKSFKAPGTENIVLSDKIKPETTLIEQCVIGYEFDIRNEISIALYNIDTKNTIVYAYNEETELEEYQNYADMGSRGVEAEYKLKFAKGNAGVNYSFYSTQNKNVIETSAVPQNTDAVLAFPVHKINVFSTFSFSHSASIYVSGCFSGPTYSQDMETLDGESIPIIKKVPEKFSINMSLNFENIFIKGLSINLAVHNISNKNIEAIQPYASGHASLPYYDREYTLKLQYEIPFKK